MSDIGRSGKGRDSRKEREEYVRNLAQEAEVLERRRKLEEQMRHRRSRRRIAYALFVAASFVAVSHVLTHAGVLTIISNQALADLAIGYPMAGILAVTGLMLLPAERY